MFACSYGRPRVIPDERYKITIKHLALLLRIMGEVDGDIIELFNQLRMVRTAVEENRKKFMETGVWPWLTI